MDTTILYITIAVLFDGLAGLSGGALPVGFVRKHIANLLAFAAGTLVGAVFFDLLPEALRASTTIPGVMVAALGGFVAFYVIESILGSHAAGQSGHKHSTIGPMILVGDAVHNISDGIAIAAAFMTDLKAGIATTLAVIVHELPQEVGDYAILVTHGYSRGRALFLLALVQLSALVGALLTYASARAAQHVLPYLLAAAAGGFLYIAAADLLPEMRRHKANSKPIRKFLAFCAGIGAMIALDLVI